MLEGFSQIFSNSPVLQRYLNKEKKMALSLGKMMLPFLESSGEFSHHFSLFESERRSWRITLFREFLLCSPLLHEHEHRPSSSIANGEYRNDRLPIGVTHHAPRTVRAFLQQSSSATKVILLNLIRLTHVNHNMSAADMDVDDTAVDTKSGVSKDNSKKRFEVKKVQSFVI